MALISTSTLHREKEKTKRIVGKEKQKNKKCTEELRPEQNKSEYSMMEIRSHTA